MTPDGGRPPGKDEGFTANGDRFRSLFGSPGPTFVVRAPGRVNLIGEHIDYNGLSVLPMAIPRRITALVRPRADGTVRVASEAAGFDERSFTLAADIPPYSVGDWGNYVKAAAQALEREYGPLTGMDLLLDSTIPVAAGLSSSSALVISIALALLAANDLSAEPVELAERMARAERYTGTQGGGMDQAICLGAQEGHASRVDFSPLRLTPIPVPPDWRFVVAHSLARAEKSGRAQETYNRRTVECRLAFETVVAQLSQPVPAYRELLQAHTPDALVELGDAVLEDPVRRRFRHVVTEADRVGRAESALRGADLSGLGQLLKESHQSLREDYEVSAPALDVLVTLALDAGAAGARLTGAGMGGCIVALCTASTAADVVSALRAHFYAPRNAEADIEQHLFVAAPAGGARVEEL
jgi:galactokinase